MPFSAPLILNQMIKALCHHDQRLTEARDCQEYSWQQDNTSSPITDFLSLVCTDHKAITIPDSPEGTATAAAAPPPKKITIKEYQHWKALEETHAATFLNKDEHGEMLDYEDFSLQDDLANIHFSSRMPTPVLEVPELMALSDGPSTIPKVTVSAPSHHPTVAANRAPGYSQGMSLSNASPMQVGMPRTSPRRTLAHGTTAEEILLRGLTLPCLLQQELSLLGLLPLLTDNHLKMMASLCTLDASGLQFICKSIEATREKGPLDHHWATLHHKRQH